MIESLDDETTTDAGHATGPLNMSTETMAVERSECRGCGSVIPPESIVVVPLDGCNPAGVARSRRVELLCEHCDLAFVLVQARRDGKWVTQTTTRAEERERERVRRAVAQQVGSATYVDPPAADDTAEAERARLAAIARLDQQIARQGELLAEYRAARAKLSGRSAGVVGSPGGGQFPYTGGDGRHLMPGGGDPGHDDPFAHG